MHLDPQRARPLVLGAEYERDEISEPISAPMSTSPPVTRSCSRSSGSTGSRRSNVRYDDNSRFGSKVTYRFAPT